MTKVWRVSVHVNEGIPFLSCILNNPHIVSSSLHSGLSPLLFSQTAFPASRTHSSKGLRKMRLAWKELFPALTRDPYLTLYCDGCLAIPPIPSSKCKISDFSGNDTKDARLRGEEETSFARLDDPSDASWSIELVSWWTTEAVRIRELWKMPQPLRPISFASLSLFLFSISFLFLYRKLPKMFVGSCVSHRSTTNKHETHSKRTKRCQKRRYVQELIGVFPLRMPKFLLEMKFIWTILNFALN